MSKARRRYSTASSPIVRGAPGRGASINPSSRCVAKRRRQVATVGRLRDLELKKAPSIAESVDWARTLIALEIRDLDDAAIAATLGAVLKHQSDHERAVRELKLNRA